MTFHSRSVVEFGQFVTGIADSLLSGEPLAVCAELIRARFGVAAVAVRVEDRQSGGQGLVTLVEQGRETLKKIQWDRAAEKVLDVYRQLTGGRA